MKNNKNSNNERNSFSNKIRGEVLGTSIYLYTKEHDAALKAGYKTIAGHKVEKGTKTVIKTFGGSDGQLLVVQMDDQIKSMAHSFDDWYAMKHPEKVLTEPNIEIPQDLIDRNTAYYEPPKYDKNYNSDTYKGYHDTNNNEFFDDVNANESNSNENSDQKFFENIENHEKNQQNTNQNDQKIATDNDHQEELNDDKQNHDNNNSKKVKK